MAEDLNADVVLRRIRFRALCTKIKNSKLKTRFRVIENHFKKLNEVYLTKLRLSAANFDANRHTSDKQLADAEEILALIDRFLLHLTHTLKELK